MIAEIHGKLSRTGSNLSETLEDNLTGNVFGTMRYLSASKALFPFLEKAYRLNEGGYQQLKLNPLPNNEPKIRFWPSNYPGVEPDLEMVLQEIGGSTTILIEVKYKSGLSSDDDPQAEQITFGESRNQLVRQMRALVSSKPNDRKIEIFLTYDAAYPFEVMDRIQNTIATDSTVSVELFWLSWHDITDSIENSLSRDLTSFERIILEDLLTLCRDRKGFRRFQGLRFRKKSIQKWKSSNVFFWKNLSNILQKRLWNFRISILQYKSIKVFYEKRMQVSNLFSRGWYFNRGDMG